MARSFRLPDLGEGIHEGEVVAVRVSVGQQIREGDIILEMETDKAAVEIPSPFTGTVTEIRVQVGDIVKVGDVMIVFDGAEADQAATPPREAEANAETEKKNRAPAGAGLARHAPPGARDGGRSAAGHAQRSWRRGDRGRCARRR